MVDIFWIRGSTAIDALGTIELEIPDGLWESVDCPIDIILDEIDIQSFEEPERRISTEGQTYIGKIRCEAIRRIEGDYYFELAERPLGLAPESERLPIPFKLRIPTVVNGDEIGFHEFYFYLTGEGENRYEVNIKITDWDCDNPGCMIAPDSGHVVANIRGIGRITQPRFLQIVQPYFINNLNPETPQQIPAGNAEMVQDCVDYILGRLRNHSQVIDDLFNHERYHSAASGEEPWVRSVVEHMTGLVYTNANQPYGGGSNRWRRWRDHLRTSGEYPACNMCDQLGSIIQWVRGVPEEYIDGGLVMHREKYRQWAAPAGSSVKWYPVESNAMASINEWAKPGASIFYQHINDGDVDHESTIIRTRGSDRNMLVQLFDYGPNIQGRGRGRGYVGNLVHVAQESGWMPITNAIHNIPNRNFWGVGWHPPETIRNLHAALGDVKLYVWRRGTEQPQSPTRDRRALHDRPAGGDRDPNKIYPITHFISALSGMPHADQIIAQFRVQSTPVFSPGGGNTSLLDIITESNGTVTLTPFPEGNPFRRH